jgi:uncharacterized protein (TIGR02996 family)
LLGQALEALDDLAPRLVYADWLEEQGDPAAELIRTQCRAVAAPPDEAQALHARAAELIASHHGAWIAPLGTWLRVDEVPFARGMLTRIYGAAGLYAQRATQDVLLSVLRRFGVRTTMVRGQSKRLGACEALAWTAELWWWDCQLDDAALEAFAASPHLARLSALTLEKVRCTNAGLRSLGASPHLTGLRHLGLVAPVHLGAFDAAALLDVVRSRRIDSLDVTGLNVALSMAELFADPAVARLTRLQVECSGPVSEVTRSRHLSGLRDLFIAAFKRVDDAELEMLLDRDAFASLERLNLRLFHGVSPGLVAKLRHRFGDGLTYYAST